MITIKLMEQVTELLQSGLVEVDETVHYLKEKNASLEAQLEERERTITDLSQVCTHLNLYILSVLYVIHNGKGKAHRNLFLKPGISFRVELRLPNFRNY